MKVHDHRKIHKSLYTGKQNVIELIDVPDLQFITAVGNGSRNVYDMHESDTLWSISRVINRLKDMTKNDMEYKFTLMPLEIIWTKNEEEGNWSWVTMMQVPDLIKQDMFQHALNELEKRNRAVKIPVKLQKIRQGLCVQTIHPGAYNQIEATTEKINSYCMNNGYRITSDFREIYINQPFCNIPDRLRTIVRAEVTVPR